jgi:hypothetical protein
MGLSRDLSARQLAGLCDGAVEQVRVRVLPDGRMTRDDAARYLGCAPKTLAMWALTGKGPGFVKVGGRVFYRLGELEKFVAEQVAA